MAAADDAAEQLLHLKLAFLAGEPPACVLTLARKAGGGSITPHVQNFILESCISSNVQSGQNCTYVTTVLRKFIAEVESSDVVIDDIYEEFGRCVSSKTNNPSLNMTYKIYKEISFLSPAPTYGNISSKQISMVARLLCSINMLEGDTGCSLWPSSLFLSEYILSNPEIFLKKCCFEVILTDGDASTLINMKTNMEMNNLCIEQEDSQLVKERENKVECKYLSWEDASENVLWDCQADVVLGADIIYDPLCVPHLVWVLLMLLRRDDRLGKNIGVVTNEETGNEASQDAATGGPVAYMATVIRNVDTFNFFAKAAADAKLSVVNITSSEAPSNLLPYMLSYDRSSVQLLRISYLS